MSCPFGRQDHESENKTNVTKTSISTGNTGDNSNSSIMRQQSLECQRIRDAVPAYYHSYLDLDKILNANHPRSSQLSHNGKAAHEEHLFITIHQTYELWFKQILYELNSCIDTLSKIYVPDRDLLTVVSRIHRITVILKVLVDQFEILETMTPLDFLDFRRYLSPASGFQSVQFRILENRLGLSKKHRMRYNKQEYHTVLTDEHSQVVLMEEKKPTLFDTIEKWLERCPYTESDHWSFWNSYKRSVNNYIEDEKVVSVESSLSLHEMFETIFNKKNYEKLRNDDNSRVRLSYEAMKSSLLILCHRDEPILQMPFKIIDGIMELEQLLTKWRNSHALMVHKMLGSKIGTGGSSGFHYLRTAAIHHKVFTDFFNLSSYMIPKSYLPKLPESIRLLMNFTPVKRSKRNVSASSSQNSSHHDHAPKAPLFSDAKLFSVLDRSTSSMTVFEAQHRNKELGMAELDSSDENESGNDDTNDTNKTNSINYNNDRNGNNNSSDKSDVITNAQTATESDSGNDDQYLQVD